MTSTPALSMELRVPDIRLSPGSRPWTAVRRLGSFAARAGFRPGGSPGIPVLRLGDTDLVLTPLAGSSSVRSALADVPVHRRLRAGARPAMLWRDDIQRLQSFYNKRLRNADTLGKCLFLAQSPSLEPSMTVEEFICACGILLREPRRDKHLLLNAEVEGVFGLVPGTCVRYDIVEDREALQSLIGRSLGSAVNSSSDRARVLPAVRFDEDQRRALGRVVDGV